MNGRKLERNLTAVNNQYIKEAQKLQYILSQNKHKTYKHHTDHTKAFKHTIAMTVSVSIK